MHLSSVGPAFWEPDPKAIDTLESQTRERILQAVTDLPPHRPVALSAGTDSVGRLDSRFGAPPGTRSTTRGNSKTKAEAPGAGDQRPR